MRTFFAALAVCVCAIATSADQTPPSERFQLTVDSIMRGPRLVGYAPSELRWSGDSKELYFEWRMPGEDEAATWVVSRDGGQPRRLSDDERHTAPLTSGSWDARRRRVLGTDRGDIVVIDTVKRARRDITRTTGTESNARWARGGTHVTDSQRVMREEERTLLDWVGQEAERRKRREERDRARALPKFELAERQTITDAALSADETYAYLIVTERGQPRTSQVPRYVSESAYTEDTATGAFSGEVSPDNSTFGLVFSSANKPPEVFLMPNGVPKSGATNNLRQLTTSTTAEWRSFKWVEPQLVTYKAYGAEVYARLYTPEMVGARRHPSNPAVVFVHGAGYLQNAHRYWSSYYRVSSR